LAALDNRNHGLARCSRYRFYSNAIITAMQDIDLWELNEAFAAQGWPARPLGRCPIQPPRLGLERRWDALTTDA